MFVDYKFTFNKDTHDIKFDDELNPEHLNIWDGKTYECEIIDGVVWFKYKEDWDMLPDPDDIDWEKHFAEGGTVVVQDWDEKRMDIIGQNGNNGEHYENKEDKSSS